MRTSWGAFFGTIDWNKLSHEPERVLMFKENLCELRIRSSVKKLGEMRVDPKNPV